MLLHNAHISARHIDRIDGRIVDKETIPPQNGPNAHPRRILAQLLELGKGRLVMHASTIVQHLVAPNAEYDLAQSPAPFSARLSGRTALHSSYFVLFCTKYSIVSRRAQIGRTCHFPSDGSLVDPDQSCYNGVSGVCPWNSSRLRPRSPTSQQRSYRLQRPSLWDRRCLLPAPLSAPHWQRGPTGRLRFGACWEPGCWPIRS